jgi:hypothetical protein
LSVYGNRSYWGTFDHIFSDTDYKSLESEITSFAGRKTGLIIPFWLADRRSDGLELGGRGKKDCFGDLEFRAKPVENLLFYPHRFSVGDYLPVKGFRPPK